jgi:hypothetical protein
METNDTAEAPPYEHPLVPGERRRRGHRTSSIGLANSASERVSRQRTELFISGSAWVWLSIT